MTGKHILVIDDDAMNREVMEAFLTLAQHEVSLAHNGERGLQMVASAQPDLIILDVKLPDMNGYDICQQLKNAPDTQQIPIMLVTGYDSESDKQQGMTAGADDFLSRPFDADDLIQRVNDLLA